MEKELICEGKNKDGEVVVTVYQENRSTLGFEFTPALKSREEADSLVEKAKEAIKNEIAKSYE